jgi:hypothetical protein
LTTKLLRLIWTTLNKKVCKNDTHNKKRRRQE